CTDGSGRDAEDLPGAGIAHEIDPCAVPVIVEMPPLPDVFREVWIEQPGAVATAAPDAWIDHPVRSRAMEGFTQSLRRTVIVGIEHAGGRSLAQIGEPRRNVENDLAELRGPARRLHRRRHEQGMVVDRLEQRRLETLGD